jgi:predicted nucleic acid-binding protein
MNLFDASAIFNLFQSGKYNVLIAGATTPLAMYEVGNVLWKSHKIRNKISKKEAIELGAVIIELIDSMEHIVPSPNSVLKLSLDEGLTFYDSSYLVSAIESGYNFVTDNLKLYSIASPKVMTRKSSEL